MRFLLFLFILLSTTPLIMAYDQKSMCSSAKQCLKLDIAGCSAEDKKPNSKIKYNDDFCAPYIELKKRGVSLETEISKEIFGRLGSQYRAIYLNEGVLQTTPGMMSYLFDHMSFTAKLINAYQGGAYSIDYKTPNRRVFSGTNGRSLSGDFIWVAQDSAGQKLGFRNVFFGVGRVKILKWHLTATAVAFLDMDSIGKNQVRYKLTAIVFPGNAILNSIMHMDAFKNIVAEKINLIIKDIQESSSSYAKGNKSPITKSKELQTTTESIHLKEFESVVKGAPWTLGDYFKKKGSYDKPK